MPADDVDIDDAYSDDGIMLMHVCFRISHTLPMGRWIKPGKTAHSRSPSLVDSFHACGGGSDVSPSSAGVVLYVSSSLPPDQTDKAAQGPA